MTTKTLRRSLLSVGLLVAAVALVGVAYPPAALAHDDHDHDHGWLGVMLDDNEIVGVIDDSPAAEAGLQEGDVIVEIDGNAVDSSRDVTRALREFGVGDRVTVTVRGDNDSERTVTATLGERQPFTVRDWNFDFGDFEFGDRFDMSELEERMPHIKEMLEGMNIQIGEDGDVISLFGEDGLKSFKSEPQGFLGVSVLQPSDELRQVMGGDADRGVIVNGITEDSAAAASGLKVGDVILRVGDDDIESSSDLTSAIRSRKPGDVVSIDISRDGSRQTLSATLGEAEGSSFMWRFDEEGPAWFGRGQGHVLQHHFQSDDDDPDTQKQRLKLFERPKLPSRDT